MTPIMDQQRRATGTGPALLLAAMVATFAPVGWLFGGFAGVACAFGLALIFAAVAHGAGPKRFIHRRSGGRRVVRPVWIRAPRPRLARRGGG